MYPGCTALKVLAKAQTKAPFALSPFALARRAGLCYCDFHALSRGLTGIGGAGRAPLEGPS